MPELPEVETTRRGIEPHIINSKIVQVDIHNSNLRWPVATELPDLITNRKVLRVTRRGKYLVLHFENGCLLWHLGMSGSLRIVDTPIDRQKHDHIEITFANKKRLRFNDPRRFGCVLWTDEDIELHKLIHHLGPEPLTNDFNSDYLFQKSRKKTQKIKSWIMDSKVVVGVGNIYANESLFLSAINPNKPAGKLTKANCELLVDNIKTVLTKAITQGGTTLRDFVGGDGKPGYFAQELNVYGKEGTPCPKCQKPLTLRKIAQRATVYCTLCQK